MTKLPRKDLFTLILFFFSNFIIFMRYSQIRLMILKKAPALFYSLKKKSCPSSPLAQSSVSFMLAFNFFKLKYPSLDLKIHLDLANSLKVSILSSWGSSANRLQILHPNLPTPHNDPSAHHYFTCSLTTVSPKHPLQWLRTIPYLWIMFDLYNQFHLTHDHFISASI